MAGTDQWINELRKALDANADCTTVRNAVRGHVVPDALRARYWKSCLLQTVSTSAESGVDAFANVYDLEEQTEIRGECRRIAEQLCANDDASDRVFVQSDLESVLTQYCKASKRHFKVCDEWQTVLHVVWTVETSKKFTYRLFTTLLSRFLPKDGLATPSWGNLFRLLLLYHEPELCNFLDTKRLLPESYAMRWFCSLFASSCDTNVTRALWDIYIYNDDPFFVFFLALVLLINAKEQIMANRGASKDELVRLIDSYATQVTVDDLEDFCTLALHYSAQTPGSFRKLLGTQLFRESSVSDTSTSTQRECRVEELLCLPVLCSDVLDMSTLRPATANKTQFVFVDCRPDDQYEHSGSLPSAFHLNAVLMLQKPTEFNEQVNLLLERLRSEDIGIEADEDEQDSDKKLRVHVCFCSSGFTVEDSYANMLIAHFLQRKVRFVSSMFAGLRSLHDAPSMRRERLEKHDERWCNYCHPPAEPRRSSSASDDEPDDCDSARTAAPATSAPNKGLLGRLSGMMKQKITSKNPTTSQNNKAYEDSNVKRNTSAQSKVKAKAKAKAQKKTSNGAPYRNAGANVFSIADDDNDDSAESFDEEEDEAARRGDSAMKREVVNVEMWLRNKPDVRHSFPCHILRENGFLVDAHLLVTETHLFVLRHLSAHPTAGTAANKSTSSALMAVIHSRRPLASVVKITSKRKIPELITFQYGVFDEEEDGDGRVRLVGCDRLLIPKAGDAIRVIKQLIVTTTTLSSDDAVATSAGNANGNGSGN